MDKGTMDTVRAQYPFMDILKFGFALVIIGIHTEVFAGIGILDMGFGVFSRIAVPIFFAISGFLYFNRAAVKGQYIKFVKRCGILYLVFSVVFFVLSCLILEVMPAGEFLLTTLTRGYRHLWFLYALIIGVGVLHVMNVKIQNKGVIYACAFVFLAAGCLLNTYASIIGISLDINILKLGITRGLLEALPPLAAGMMLAQRGCATSPAWRMMCLLGSFVLLCAETFIAVKYLHVTSTVSWFFTVPCVYFILCNAVRYTQPMEHAIFRKTATLLYLVHPAFILCLSGIVKPGQAFFGITAACSLSLALGVYVLSKHKYGHGLKYIL